MEGGQTGFPAPRVGQFLPLRCLVPSPDWPWALPPGPLGWDLQWYRTTCTTSTTIHRSRSGILLICFQRNLIFLLFRVVPDLEKFSPGVFINQTHFAKHISPYFPKVRHKADHVCLARRGGRAPPPITLQQKLFTEPATAREGEAQRWMGGGGAESLGTRT